MSQENLNLTADSKENFTVGQPVRQRFGVVAPQCLTTSRPDKPQSPPKTVLTGTIFAFTTCRTPSHHAKWTMQKANPLETSPSTHHFAGPWAAWSPGHGHRRTQI
jgi:hypothetical protein